jgi:hypothetical protein
MPGKDIGRQPHTVHKANETRERSDEYALGLPFQGDWLVQYDGKTLDIEIPIINSLHPPGDYAHSRFLPAEITSENTMFQAGFISNHV